MSKKTLWFIFIILTVLLSVVGLILVAFGHLGWSILCLVLIFICVIGIVLTGNGDFEDAPTDMRNFDEFK